MSIKFRCQHCSTVIEVPDRAAGKRVQCEKCGVICSIPLETSNVDGITADAGLLADLVPLPSDLKNFGDNEYDSGDLGLTSYLDSVRLSEIPTAPFTPPPVSSLPQQPVVASKPPAVVFPCRACQQKVKVSALSLGKKVKCPFCTEVQKVPKRAQLVVSENPSPVPSKPTASKPSPSVPMPPPVKASQSFPQDSQFVNQTAQLLVEHDLHPDEKAPVDVHEANFPQIAQNDKTKPNKGAGSGNRCAHCGSPVLSAAVICPACGSPVKNSTIAKSPLTYVLIALFLVGSFGIPNFYAGRYTQAIIQLILSITIVGLIVFGLWAIIDAIIVAKNGCGTNFV